MPRRQLAEISGAGPQIRHLSNAILDRRSGVAQSYVAAQPTYLRARTNHQASANARAMMLSLVLAFASVQSQFNGNQEGPRPQPELPPQR